MTKICKHFVKGDCKKGDNCEYKHVPNVCRKYFFEECTRVNCKFSHVRNNTKSKNTESFIPKTIPADMRIIPVSNSSLVYPHRIYSNDVIVIPAFFKHNNLYEKLLSELEKVPKQDDLWKLWHGDTHMIADDHQNWKNSCPLFIHVINAIANYFNMQVKATRLNHYRDDKEWKPYHHDAAAVDEKKTKTQNFTVGVSFGATRDISWEHATSRTHIDFPLFDGTVYAFGKNVNVEWRHGIPQSKYENTKGRISIIAWGWVEQEDKL